MTRFWKISPNVTVCKSDIYNQNVECREKIGGLLALGKGEPSVDQVAGLELAM